MALQEGLLELALEASDVASSLGAEFDRAYGELAEANKAAYAAYFTQVGRSFFARACSQLRSPCAAHAASARRWPRSANPGHARARRRTHRQVRDLLNGFFLGLAGGVPALVERYGAAADNPELDALPEDVALLLGDKEALTGAIQVRTRVCFPGRRARALPPLSAPSLKARACAAAAAPARPQSCHELHASRLDALEDRLVAAEAGRAAALAEEHAAARTARHRCAASARAALGGRPSGAHARAQA